MIGNRQSRRAEESAPCRCGSGKKHKNCCGLIAQRELAVLRKQAEAVAASLPAWRPVAPPRVEAPQ